MAERPPRKVSKFLVRRCCAWLTRTPLAVSLTTFSDAPEKLGPLTASARRRIFQQIIVKCVLQLLLIETTHELLQNDDVYNTIPAKHLLRFMTALDDSYEFARKFNADKDLRMALWKVGE